MGTDLGHGVIHGVLRGLCGVEVSDLLKLIFGGDGPKANERRYVANGELKAIADLAEPWTVEGLRAAVAEWLADPVETP